MRRTSCQFFLFIVLIAAVLHPAFAAAPKNIAAPPAMPSVQGGQADAQAVQPDSETGEKNQNTKDKINWLELAINISGCGLVCAVVNYLLDLRKERRARSFALMDSLFEAFGHRFMSGFLEYDDPNLTAFQEKFQDFLSEQSDTLKLLQENKRCKEVIDKFTLDKLLSCAQGLEKKPAENAIRKYVSEIHASLMRCIK